MKPRLLPFCLALTASLSLLSGCLEQGIVLNKPGGSVAAPGRFTGDPARLSKLEINIADRSEVAEGESIQLEVRALDDQGREIDPTLLQLEWNAENGSVIQIDETGKVTGLKAADASKVTVTDIKTHVSATGEVTVTGTVIPPSPTPTPTPEPPHTGSPPSPVPSPTPTATPLPGPRLARLVVTPGSYVLEDRGDSITYFVEAFDTNGQHIDPASLDLVWHTDKPLNFSVEGQVIKALVKGLKNSGYAQIIVTDQPTGIKGEARVLMDTNSGGGGGGGGSTPAPVDEALTEPVVDFQNYSYAGSLDGNLYAFDETGFQVWSFEADGAITRNPGATVVNDEFRIYFGTDEGTLYSVHANEGSDDRPVEPNDWSVQLPGGAAVTTAPLVDLGFDGGAVVVGDAQGRVHAYQLDDGELLEFPGSAPFLEISDEALRSSPVRFAASGDDDGFLIATQDNDLCRVVIGGNAVCNLLDDFDEDLPDDAEDPSFVADPAITGEDILNLSTMYIGSTDGYLYMIELNDDDSTIDEVDVFELNDAEDDEEDSLPAQVSVTNPAAAYSYRDGIGSNDLIFVPVGGDLVLLDHDLFGGDTNLHDITSVCATGETIVGAPLITGTDSLSPTANVTCSDGNVYHLAYDLDDVDDDIVFNDVDVTSNPITGPADDLIAGPAISHCGDPDNLLIGGPDGTLQFVNADNPLLTRNSEDWSKFRFDYYNSGVYFEDPPGNVCE